MTMINTEISHERACRIISGLPACTLQTAELISLLCCALERYAFATYRQSEQSLGNRDALKKTLKTVEKLKCQLQDQGLKNELLAAADRRHQSGSLDYDKSVLQPWVFVQVWLPELAESLSDAIGTPKPGGAQTDVALDNLTLELADIYHRATGTLVSIPSYKDEANEKVSGKDALEFLAFFDLVTLDALAHRRPTPQSMRERMRKLSHKGVFKQKRPSYPLGPNTANDANSPVIRNNHEVVKDDRGSQSTR